MRRALVLVAAFSFVQCASLVAVDDEQDAAERLCVCPDLTDAVFDDAASCRASITRSLDAALESARANWLARFNDLGCGESCEHALECYQTPPTCVPEGIDCDTDEECCSQSCDGTTETCTP